MVKRDMDARMPTIRIRKDVKEGLDSIGEFGNPNLNSYSKIIDMLIKNYKETH